MKTIANFNRITTWTIGLVTREGAPVPMDYAMARVHTILEENGFDGFTAVPGLGYWKGMPEQCVVVTLCSDDSGGMTLGRAKAVAGWIAAHLGQECVMVTHISRDTPMAYLVEA